MKTKYLGGIATGIVIAVGIVAVLPAFLQEDAKPYVLVMLAFKILTRCSRCDVVLSGREQFVGHMIHGHDMEFTKADAIWKSMCASTHNIH
jgi:uncharacterized C2H2 Zn-finger protein